VDVVHRAASGRGDGNAPAVPDRNHRPHRGKRREVDVVQVCIASCRAVPAASKLMRNCAMRN